jgi:RNA polymerase sigma-70 factor, ECF subfamily
VDGDPELVNRLRAGDEQAFVDLVARYHGSMLRLARTFVASTAVAEEVVQDAWLAVLSGLSGFQERSSLKTWLFQILVNRARSAGAREHRNVPLGEPEAAVDRSRFDPTGHWRSPLQHWSDDIDDRLRADKMAARIHGALDELPAQQREVVTLRDVEGLSSREVCALLEISQDNQRVLLHRGRSRLRGMLEGDFEEDQP